MTGGLRRYLAWRLAVFFPLGVAVVGTVTALLLGEVEQLFSRAFLPTLVLGLVVAAGTGAGLGWAIAGRVTRPVQELVDGARRLAAGEFDRRVHVEGPDELVTLARAFNEMAARLRATVDELDAERERLATVLGTMTSGVLFIERDGRLRLANPAARRMLDLPPHAEGLDYVSVTRSYPLVQAIETGLRTGRPVAEDVTLPADPGETPRHLRVAVVTVPTRGTAPPASPRRRPPGALDPVDVAGGRAGANAESRTDATPAALAGTQGVVVVLHDVTDIRRLEQIRRDFVANVSHELRTPVAAIQGFAETLLEGAIHDDPATAEHFARVIHREAERMARLVQDLLDLARLESPEPGLRREPLDLRESARAAAQQWRPRLEAAGLDLVLELPPEPVPVFADPHRLDQVWTNLLDNARQHTPSGGTVTVVVRREEAARPGPAAGPGTRGARAAGGAGDGAAPRTAAGSLLQAEEAGPDQAGTAPPAGGPRAAWAVGEVRDTGHGIPPEALPRIFERFYRVDRGRSRAAGGTGLGLAIVKHVVEAHGGTVEAESELGRGTTVRFRLPLRGPGEGPDDAQRPGGERAGRPAAGGARGGERSGEPGAGEVRYGEQQPGGP
ncbi:HAMP domain-containing protein [Thermaerobacter sp. FW80]|uniref:ATP-binding protein n=1 Tax=Thermaerobacter sp. FW80 TaxID=2546351 RepID=UPI001074A21D|nr:ATP-binding protein [Thermaerobacter sp. FW80]QBS38304.1 HAMP domain-containing protein [Thermaerobacter sp. FW80]